MEGDSSTFAYDEQESIILNGSSGPCRLPLEYLRRITNNFADERLLGEGGFGKVYKGVLRNGKMVAVKRLDQLLKPGVQERQFENEVYHLMRLKHPNIVRFVGYCYETRNECVEHDGKYIFAEIQQKLICLEYLPNGSLDRHLSDESSGDDWHIRYKIIKGICCGLLYLHEECQRQFGASIIHLDLKPGNILLDEYMVPKITDFGLSRLFEDDKTQIATFLLGTFGYMAPEYLIARKVTAKADIYSLGVIITEIITGTKVDIFSFSSPTFYRKFVDDVINNWRNRLGGALSETDCKQIKCCLEIGLGCIKFNREERPTSREIIERLDTWETTNCNINNEKRSPADQILTHVEEKPSASTTGGSIYCALQHNITVKSTAAADSNSNTNSITVRSTAAADSNSNTNTGNGLRSYGSPNRLHVRGLFRGLSRAKKFLSFTFMTRRLSRLSSSLLRRAHYHDNNGSGGNHWFGCFGGCSGGGGNHSFSCFGGGGKSYYYCRRPVRLSHHRGRCFFGGDGSDDDDYGDFFSGGNYNSFLGGDNDGNYNSFLGGDNDGNFFGRGGAGRGASGVELFDIGGRAEFDVGGERGELLEHIVTPSCYRDSHPLPGRDPTEEFAFAQMEAATMGFSLEAKIGEGSFGTVYRGYLPDGREVAIKRGESGPRDDHHFHESEFQSEVAFLSRLRHKHLVELVGYCTENKEFLLVCEYMKNGALYDHLHPKPKAEPSESSPSSLVMSSWKLRIRILLDASRGIDYLHSYAVSPIIHRDIKSSNILLDASWRARLSGFGLSLEELQAQRWAHRTDDFAGTVGYMDPEYNSLHHLTLKSDVYGFGVVMLEVLTGKPAILEESDDEDESPMSVVDYAVPSIISGELGKVLDPHMPEPAAHEAEALGLVAFIAVHCVRLKGKDRPAMAGIVANLEKAFALCEGNFDGDLVESPSSDSLPIITSIDQD